ncbi:hypothetical protein AMATHDRAFT_147399 [Amanita thiersii Skay4041]|uniref:Uncharacterized protein n=1 Tax=Amanita thiersii Skay4041 TaxID=703135 RepID=A0A2A9NP81_9AGAR|nr:hypothetical protein AMATHDRAFT_147399 [Amanita thiersii Skay4041]
MLRRSSCVYSSQLHYTALRTSLAVSLNHSLRTYKATAVRRQHGPEPIQPHTTRNGVSKLLTALLVFGVGVTAYGLYDIYGAMTIWPQAVRHDLRDALKAKYKGDLPTCEAYFRRSWSTAKSLSPTEFVPQPCLKTTGIAIALASVLESMNHMDQAYEVYADGLSYLQNTEGKAPLTKGEQMRGVALACKLGELAHDLDRGKDEEEKWLVWAVETILKNIMVNTTDHISNRGKPNPETRIESVELGLPGWVSATDLAAPFEALGSLYAQTGKNDYAIRLFLQAASILIPPTPQKASAVDRCRGAQTMSSISELIMRADPSNQGIAQAETWARKAFGIINEARAELQDGSKKWIGGTQASDPTCEIAYAVSLFNIGALREMAGDTVEAKRFLDMSLQHSKRIGLEEGMSVARDALKRIEGPRPDR